MSQIFLFYIQLNNFFISLCNKYKTISTKRGIIRYSKEKMGFFVVYYFGDKVIFIKKFAIDIGILERD